MKLKHNKTQSPFLWHIWGMRDIDRERRNRDKDRLEPSELGGAILRNDVFMKHAWPLEVVIGRIERASRVSRGARIPISDDRSKIKQEPSHSDVEEKWKIRWAIRAVICNAGAGVDEHEADVFTSRTDFLPFCVVPLWHVPRIALSRVVKDG
jgi:hypothetical protein